MRSEVSGGAPPGMASVCRREGPDGSVRDPAARQGNVLPARAGAPAGPCGRRFRIAIFLATVFSTGISCGHRESAGPAHLLPDPALVRQALERSLRRWQDAPEQVLTATPRDSVVFVDQQHQPAQELHEYAILSESETESSRRFLVRLSLASPEETITAVYHVFGKDPIWVYRSEDLDIVMHWECPMDSDPGASSAPEAEATPNRPDAVPQTFAGAAH